MPTIVILFVLIAVDGLPFDTNTAPRCTGAVFLSNCLSCFFFVATSKTIKYSYASADYVVCMYQTYPTGPMTVLVGNGAGLGLPVASGLTIIVYPPATQSELKYDGR